MGIRLSRVPFIKWPGGKSWLYHNFKHLFPAKYNRYIDPFTGGGSIFFLLSPQSAILNDINDRLVEAYEVLKTNPYNLCQLLIEHNLNNSKDYYKYLSSYKATTQIERAGIFIYMSILSHRGAIRYTKKRTIRISYNYNGQIPARLMDYQYMKGISDILQKAILYCGDYKQIIALSEKDDLLFVDPPYNVDGRGVVQYGNVVFDKIEQSIICNMLIEAKKRGVKIISTNIANDYIIDMYEPKFNIQFVQKRNEMRGTNNYYEVIITGNL